MAITLATEGKSAQVIQHPRALPTPVVQARRPGRHPRGVASISIFLRKKQMAKIYATPAKAPPAPMTKVQELEEVLFHLAKMVKLTEYDLCRAKQIAIQQQG